MKTNDTQNNAQHLERAPGSAAPRHQHPAHPCVCWRWGGAVSPQSESGEGRALEQADDGVYYISSAEELRAFAEKVNGGETDASAVLTADIDLNPGFTFKEDGSYSGPDGEEPHQWIPIGTNSSRYSGNFNGQNFKISGLYIDSSADYQGLFGYVSGKVQNLSVSGSVKGYWYVGGIVGQNLGTVINCAFSGSVSGSEYVGGVVGENSGSSTVENCYNTGEVSGDWYVGGVVGYNGGSNGVVKNCYNTGNISGGISGGVVGDNRGTVENCYNIGEVSGMGVGGVVGWNYGGGVANCFFLQGTADKGIGIDSGSATPLSAEAFESQESFSSWTDFDNTWKIEPIFGRPTLKDNAEIGGTANNPYKIFTATQLAAFRDLVNSEDGQTADPDAHAKLMNDIDLKDVCGPELDAETSWEPIGNSFSNSYSGTFNGNGKTISGLYIDSSGVDYKGLFGRVNGGTVKDLTVSGSVSGDMYVGGVVGYNNGGTVTGCIFSGSGSVSGGEDVGGVVGRNDGTVKNCHNTGKVSGNRSVGGVVGLNRILNAMSAKRCAWDYIRA